MSIEYCTYSKLGQNRTHSDTKTKTIWDQKPQMLSDKLYYCQQSNEPKI